MPCVNVMAMRVWIVRLKRISKMVHGGHVMVEVSPFLGPKPLWLSLASPGPSACIVAR